MALITRISRLFKADLHAVLDCIEEPDVLLKQSIREMEELLTQDQQQIQHLRLQHQRLRQRTTDCEQSLDAIDAQLDICFNAQQHDLARSQIKRKLELQGLSKTLRHESIVLQETLTKVTAELEAKQRQLDSMRQKAEMLLKDHHYAPVDKTVQTTDCCVRDEDVEVAFLQEQQIRRQS